jgi:hypothetical protein
VVVAGVLDGQSSGAGAVVPEQEENTVSITVVGASGDLAKKKIFPALFALFYEDWLPKVSNCGLPLLIQLITVLFSNFCFGVC